MTGSIFMLRFLLRPPHFPFPVGTPNRHHVSYPERSYLSLGGRCIALFTSPGFFYQAVRAFE
jgi:hypothetical protein